MVSLFLPFSLRNPGLPSRLRPSRSALCARAVAVRRGVLMSPVHAVRPVLGVSRIVTSCRHFVASTPVHRYTPSYKWLA